jgi:hypothetical protein
MLTTIIHQPADIIRIHQTAEETIHHILQVSPDPTLQIVVQEVIQLPPEEAQAEEPTQEDLTVHQEDQPIAVVHLQDHIREAVVAHIHQAPPLLHPPGVHQAHQAHQAEGDSKNKKFCMI